MIRRYPFLAPYLVDDGLECAPDKDLEYLCYLDGRDTIILDGKFTADQLEEIVQYMREHAK